ncbi:APG5-domain-containing protein [Sarocladium strictum]
MGQARQVAIRLFIKARTHSLSSFGYPVLSGCNVIRSKVQHLTLTTTLRLCTFELVSFFPLHFCISDNRDVSTAIMTSSSSALAPTLWAARIPLHITHASSPVTSPFITSIPRFSYLALLLPRLSAYFGTPCSSFHFEDVQLRNLAVGLLADLYQPSLPWRLTVNDGIGWDIGDTFLNCVKEADFIRNGNANQIMKMSKDHTTQLWNSVIDNDYASFSRIQTRLLNAPTALKHIPLRIYIPTADEATAGSYRVVQSLVPSTTADRKPQLLGQALKNMLPGLFPSSRDPVLVGVVLHGAAVPFEAPLGELMREAAYPDGWLCFVVTI